MQHPTAAEPSDSGAAKPYCRGLRNPLSLCGSTHSHLQLTAGGLAPVALPALLYEAAQGEGQLQEASPEMFKSKGSGSTVHTPIAFGHA